MVSLESLGGGGAISFTQDILIAVLIAACPASAQKSPPCTSAPCVEVGLEDQPASGLQFDSDTNHFVYCPQGQTVRVEVLAKFDGATACPGCAHGPRTVTWTVTGAEEYSYAFKDTFLQAMTIAGASALGAQASIDLGEAGDTITVTCTVGNADTEGECEEYRPGKFGTHGGNHDGATASCTIKLWRMDLEVGETSDDPEEDPDPVDPTSPGGNAYETVFAKSITTTGKLIGAAPAATPPWSWESVIESPTIHNTQSGGTSWGGEMVAPTSIFVTAHVVNGCDPAATETAMGQVEIQPTIRRPGWTTEVQVAASDVNWLSDEPNAFPELDWSQQINGIRPTYGRLANARVPYDLNFTAAVVPIYADLAEYPSDYLDFSSKITQIPDGPNKNFYYNSDPTMFEIRRKILSNHWIHPSAGHPIVPSLDNDGLLYNNWLQVIEVAFGADCKCLDPTDHGGTGTAAWWRANLWHEGRGSPDSPNKRLLGHLSRLEDHFATHPRSLVDPIYRCDLLYATTEAELRAADEFHRQKASEELYGAIVELHNYVSGNTLKHNFNGDIWIFGPPSGWTTGSKLF